MNIFFEFFKTVFKNFAEDGCLYRASSLAFTCLLGLVPLMAIGFVILSFFPSMQFLGAKVQTFIFNNLVASSGKVLGQYAAQFSQQVLHMSWIGVAALIIIVVLLMFSVENALNAIWKLPKRPGRFAILRAIGRHWLLLIFVPTLLSGSLVISSYVLTLGVVKKIAGHVHLPNLMLLMLPTILLFLAFTAIYKFIPAAHVRTRHAAIGGLVATVLFSVSKLLFKLYVTLFPTYKMLYGAFAAVPLFLIWIYIVWLIVLFAAEITWLLGKQQ